MKLFVLQKYNSINALEYECYIKERIIHVDEIWNTYDTTYSDEGTLFVGFHSVQIRYNINIIYVYINIIWIICLKGIIMDN